MGLSPKSRDSDEAMDTSRQVPTKGFGSDCLESYTDVAMRTTLALGGGHGREPFRETALLHCTARFIRRVNLA